MNITSFILINGIPTRFFHSSWGLRQGDMLSPSLFLNGMEAFRIIFGDYLSSCRVLRRKPQSEVEVCFAKNKEGLGVRCLSTRNRALLSKWSGRFIVGNNPFWKIVINLEKKREGVLTSLLWSKQKNVQDPRPYHLEPIQWLNCTRVIWPSIKNIWFSTKEGVQKNTSSFVWTTTYT